MFSREQALEIARRVEDCSTSDGSRELEQGWYFPFDTESIGSNGLIVNKRSGRVMELGSAFPIERDLDLYDKGYQFERYDLVVTSVSRLEATLDTLVDLEMSVIELTYEHGSVWRIPRPMTRQEIGQRVSKLPCVFGDVRLYFVIEKLEAARARADFACELFEYRQPP